MGLDIYLRKCADREAARKAEEAHEQFRNTLWAGLTYDETTTEQREEIAQKSRQKAEELGINNYSHNSVVEVCEPSSTSQAHLFKLGYFRSSYNEGGIERVMRNLSLPTLADIFGYADEYEFKPDWDRALLKVGEAIAGYEAHLKSDAGRYLVTQVKPYFGHGVETEAQARELVLQAMKRYDGPDFRAFSTAKCGARWKMTADGEFWLDGLKVVGIVTKKYDPPASSDVIGRIINTPSVFVVYEREKEPEQGEDWYLTALKIVRESIEFVIAQPDRQDFYLVWSS